MVRLLIKIKDLPGEHLYGPGHWAKPGDNYRDTGGERPYCKARWCYIYETSNPGSGKQDMPKLLTVSITLILEFISYNIETAQKPGSTRIIPALYTAYIKALHS